MNTLNKLKKISLSSLLIIFCFSSIALASVNYPLPTNYKYVNDYVGILGSKEIETII
ncbi:TPM domain-containing protein, partial [Clostridium perfringens]|nr:TPM domain-containing protein [Clostridium perfringens]